MLRIATLALLLASVPAQHDAAGPKAVGIVVDSAGERVGEATVHLVSWPLPARTDIGSPHRVTASTDADGRFSTTVLAGRSYSAWATWRTNDTIRRTALIDDLTPAVPRKLREGPVQQRRRIDLRGSTHWEGLGPLRITASVGRAHPFSLELQADARRELRLGDLPADDATITVHTAAGQLVAAMPLDTTAEGAAALPLPEPFAVRLRVRDEHGAPIAEATVSQMTDFGFHRPWHLSRGPERLGTTAEDGTLRVHVPERHPFGDDAGARLLLLVQCAAHQPQTLDLVLQRDAQAREHVVTLPPGAPISGRLLNGDDPVVEGATLLVTGFARTGSTHVTGGLTALAPQALAIAADGSFVTHGQHAMGGVRLLATWTPERLAALQQQLGTNWPLPPFWAVLDRSSQVREPSLELRLDRRTFVPCEVRRHDGSPAAGAWLRLSLPQDVLTPMLHVTDHRGRLLLPVPHGDHAVFAAIAGGGIARAEAPPPEERSLERPLVLTLTQPRTIRGRVVDGAGRPIAEVRVRVNEGTPDDPALGPAVHLTLSEVDPTDADGRFAVNVPTGNGIWTLEAFRTANARPVTIAVEVDQQDRDDVLLTIPDDAGR
ncbi:MAG: hypothetical protein IPK26_21640 [Planctomycetes bacterium]|nr:hypothetical protein [Planctomycetota bacterium]